MAAQGFLAQDLPSSDEEDEDYNPLADKTNPELAQLRKDGGLIAGPSDLGGDDEDDDEDNIHNPLSRAAKRKARAEEAFKKLQEMSKDRKRTGALGGMYSVHEWQRCMKPAAAAPKDDLWMLSLGLGKRKRRDTAQGQAVTTLCAPEAQRNGAEEREREAREAKRCHVSEEALEVAKTARRTARDATSLTYHREVNKVVVQEERKFAGENVIIEKKVDKDSKEAAKAAGKKVEMTNLQKLVKSLKKGNKVSIVDKTKADWDKWKSQQEHHVQEELEAYKKSSNKYLDRQDFLKRAELREYERQRDARLASDVRTRGRL